MAAEDRLLAQLKRAINELQRIGVKVYVERVGDTGLVFLDIKSIGEAILRRIQHPCKSVLIESGYLIIKVDVACREKPAQRT